MALNGLRVIEFYGVVPGPFCGMVLADFGANVIRIDKLELNHYQDVLSNGKKSIALNLKNPKAIKIIKKLCMESDVLIEQFRPGVMEKLGLGPDDLMKQNERLIYVRITGYGQDGYYAKRPGHNVNFLSLTGLLSLFARPNEKPCASNYGGSDVVPVVGILLALIERTKSGRGQIVDSNIVESLAYSNSWLYKLHEMPLIPENKRGENFLSSGMHFYEIYETKDNKYMAVGAVEPQFYANLLKTLGLSKDDVKQFGNFAKKKELFTKIFLKRTRDEWAKIFDGTDACVTPVLSIEEASTHPHNLSMDSFIKFNNHLVVKPTPRLGRTPGKSVGYLKRPINGEHSREILKGLGYDDVEIVGLVEEGVVGVHNFSSRL